MPDNAHKDTPRPRVQVSSAPGSSVTLAGVWGCWKAYWKLALGILLVTLVVVFVIQNADATHVKFLAWATDMSQALVVMVSLLSGVALGVVFSRWQQWRSSRAQR